ncbi:MAG: SpoIIE family protein phosphatase [Vicinamibacteria bacterium]|nr:SpoIIE family protein phosphatase [Vicinamibacteria bacterium]
MPRIEMEKGDGRSWSVPLRGDHVTIGRSQDNDICLPDQWLSRHHAEIRRRANDHYLIDLGSRNGSFINESRARNEEKLKHGDLIRLGENRLRFLDDEREPAFGKPTLPTEAVPPRTKVFTMSEMFATHEPSFVENDASALQNRSLGLIAETASILLVEHRPLPDIYERILSLLMRAVPAERAAILRLEGDPPEPTIKASRSRCGESIARISRSIARKVVRERVVLLLPDIMEDADLSSRESILTTGIRSALCAPLWFRAPSSDQDAVIGLVYLDTRRHDRPLCDADVPIASALANIAAAKIENVRLLDESIEKRRLEEDIRVAAEVQRSLLPRDLPRVAGHDLAGSTRPCHAVGGDYYDLLADDHRLLLSLGDVSGKGTSAALLMSVLRASARAHWRDDAPAAAMARINRTVFENTPANRYVTFFLAALDIRDDRLRFVNAGHNPGLLIRAGGGVERLRDGGVALGVFEEAHYEEGETRLLPGDTLLLYSDGVTETWNEREEEFGEAGLIGVVTRCRRLGASAIESEIYQELERFAPGTRAMDDRTLLVVKRLPCPVA